MKVFIQKHKYWIVFLIFLALVLWAGFYILDDNSKELQMLNYMKNKYDKEFVTVNYINTSKEENEYVDILTLIPKNELKEDEDPTRLMGDKRVSNVYYNRQTDEITDNYFGTIIRDEYFNLINDVVSSNFSGKYKLYFSIYNVNTFPNEYKKDTQMYDYISKFGKPNALLTMFVETSDGYSSESAERDIKKVMEELKKQEFPVTITTYFLEDTKVKDLDEDIRLAIGVMNETEKDEPEYVTYIIDGNFDLTKEEIIDKDYQTNDGLSMSIK